MKFSPQPCEFPRVSGHPLHHGMTNQNGQGQVLGGQAPSESARLGAKQGHAKSATFMKDFSDQKNNSLRPLRERSTLLSTTTNLPSRPLREQSAFSLTEVVIAMGVAAVAFTSIIALFPLGLNMSKESYEATQAALIAQTIMADLKDEQSGGGNLRRKRNPGRYRLLQISPNSDPMDVEANYAEILIYTTNPQTAYIAYKPNDGANSDTDTSNPLIMRPYTYSYTEDNATAPSWYNGGTNGAFALVKVTISPTLPSDTGNEGSPRRIDMSIETPGSANVSNRTCYLFTGASHQ